MIKGGIKKKKPRLRLNTYYNRGKEKEEEEGKKGGERGGEQVQGKEPKELEERIETNGSKGNRCPSYRNRVGGGCQFQGQWL